MCWVSGPCWLGCLRGWGLRTSLLRLTHFGAVSGGRPGEALRVSWSANSPSSPRLLVAKARAVRSAHRDCYLLLPPPAKQTRWGLSTLQEGISSRASRPLPVDLQLVGHEGGVPSLCFPRRNLECPLHKAGQALWALDLTPEEERGPSPLQDRPLPKSEFFSEAHSMGPGMGRTLSGWCLM